MNSDTVNSRGRHTVRGCGQFTNSSVWEQRERERERVRHSTHTQREREREILIDWLIDNGTGFRGLGEDVPWALCVWCVCVCERERERDARVRHT